MLVDEVHAQTRMYRNTAFSVLAQGESHVVSRGQRKCMGSDPNCRHHTLENGMASMVAPRTFR